MSKGGAFIITGIISIALLQVVERFFIKQIEPNFINTAIAFWAFDCCFCLASISRISKT